jgi:glycosyltransferase involved in cell wall biosynthesis
MRIALVTEHFVPHDDPSARVAREVVTRLTGAGHDVVVFAGGRGQSTFHGARVFWASRMTPVSAVREAMALSRPDVCHLLDPHRLGLKAAEAAERLDVPVLVLDPRTWVPGVDLEDHHPGLRDQRLHDRWARAGAPGEGLTVVGYVGPLERRKVVQRLTGLSRTPGLRLVAVGDGPGAEALRAAGAKVVAHATTLERATCVASFDVLVQPRKREVYSPVVTEALASGVPVVAFASGSAATVVEHGVNGLLVPTDRGGRALGRAVGRLAQDAGLRGSLAGAARASVAGRDWESSVGRLVADHYAPTAGTPADAGTAAR